MSHSPVPDNPGKIVGGMTPRRRRHFAAWLLAGWVAFWLFTVIQPCCQNPVVDDTGHSTAVQIAGDAARTGSPCGSTPLDDEFCQAASPVQVASSDTAGAFPSRVDISFDAASAAIVPMPRYAGTFVSYSPSDSPVSGAPLYLRHQRFLI